MTTKLTVQVGPIKAAIAKAGRGRPLVYLHGAFGYSGWHPFLDLLARRFTVYAPLHPGFGDEGSGIGGRGSGEINPPTPAKGGVEQIDDLLDLTLYHFDLLDALGLKSPHLVGHFFGAMVAAEMAALRPNRVNRLVLAAPAGLWLDDNPGLDYFATPAGQLRKALFADPESAIARSALPEPQNDDERAQQNIERVRSLSVVGKFLWPIPDKGLKKRLHRIQAPTLVVVAEHDQLVPPAYGHEFASRISGARLEVVKGAGHMLILEKPDEFAPLVTGFLRET